jgi:hypothetical protein
MVERPLKRYQSCFAWSVVSKFKVNLNLSLESAHMGRVPRAGTRLRGEHFVSTNNHVLFRSHDFKDSYRYTGGEKYFESIEWSSETLPLHWRQARISLGGQFVYADGSHIPNVVLCFRTH